MFVSKCKILFGECDPAGILFFANIYKYAHSAFEDLLTTENYYTQYFKNSEFAFPIIHSSADYFDTLNLGEEIEIQINVVNIKKRSFEIHYDFLKNNRVKAKVKTVHVCIDLGKLLKDNLPEELLIILKKHFKE